jgi:hypothetical protein
MTTFQVGDSSTSSCISAYTRRALRVVSLKPLQVPTEGVRAESPLLPPASVRYEIVPESGDSFFEHIDCRRVSLSKNCMRRAVDVPTSLMKRRRCQIVVNEFCDWGETHVIKRGRNSPIALPSTTATLRPSPGRGSHGHRLRLRHHA